MAEQEAILMKGNEAIAHAAIRCGCDGYFGYPITPQSEVIETLAELKPWETTGMVVVQAESELASIYMVYGAQELSCRVFLSTYSAAVPDWEPYNPRRATISKPRAEAATATITSSCWHLRPFRRWPTSSIWLSNWRSSTAIRP